MRIHGLKPSKLQLNCEIEQKTPKLLDSGSKKIYSPPCCLSPAIATPIFTQPKKFNDLLTFGSQKQSGESFLLIRKLQENQFSSGTSHTIIFGVP